MNEPKKVIFFDADGTIAKGGFVSDQTKKTLKELKKQGHLLILSTGRALPAITGDLAAIDMDGIISSSGASVSIHGEVIYSRAMSRGAKEEITAYFDDKNILYNVETNDYIWIAEGKLEAYMSILAPDPGLALSDPKRYAFELVRQQTARGRTRETADLISLDILKIHYYAAEFLYPNGFPITFDTLVEDLGKTYNCVQLSLGKQFSGGEVNELGITKEQGMKVIEQYYNVSHEQTIAIGDDYNDLEMLQYANYSIAMGNAPDSIKQVADKITLDIDHEGFTRAFEDLQMI